MYGRERAGLAFYQTWGQVQAVGCRHYYSWNPRIWIASPGVLSIAPHILKHLED